MLQLLEVGSPVVDLLLRCCKLLPLSFQPRSRLLSCLSRGGGKLVQLCFELPTGFLRLVNPLTLGFQLPFSILQGASDVTTKAAGEGCSTRILLLHSQSRSIGSW